MKRARAIALTTLAALSLVLSAATDLGTRSNDYPKRLIGIIVPFPEMRVPLAKYGTTAATFMKHTKR
jgi:hypothetical protein